MTRIALALVALWGRISDHLFTIPGAMTTKDHIIP